MALYQTVWMSYAVRVERVTSRPGHWRDDWKNNPSKIRTDIFYLLRN